jgi:hypothetical protein
LKRLKISRKGERKKGRMQECKNARMQECKNARMQECKNARMQECKNARMQECKNARMQECKNARKGEFERYVSHSVHIVMYLVELQVPHLPRRQLNTVLFRHAQQHVAQHQVAAKHHDHTRDETGDDE